MTDVAKIINDALDNLEALAAVNGCAFIDTPSYFVGCLSDGDSLVWKTARSGTPRASSRKAAMNILLEFGYRP